MEVKSTEIRFKVKPELMEKIVKKKAQFELETGIQLTVNDWILKHIKNGLND